MIVADTSAMLALMDAGDRHHDAMVEWYDADPDGWIMPWAVVPELDYMLMRLDPRAELAFVRDVAESRFAVDWGEAGDMRRVRELAERYRALKLGIVDATVVAIAERRRADAIATLDIRHFGAVHIAGDPLLLPRDG